MLKLLTTALFLGILAAGAVGTAALAGSLDCPGAAGQAEVQMYSCVFVGDVDVVDVNNQSVIDPNRPVLVEYEATFLSSAEGILRLEEETVWNGGGVCEQ